MFTSFDVKIRIGRVNIILFESDGIWAQWVLVENNHVVILSYF